MRADPDVALKQLLGVLWQDGWDNTIFSLGIRDDGSLESGLRGFLVSRNGVELGAEWVPDGGPGAIAVKLRLKEAPASEFLEEHFACLEIWDRREVLRRTEKLLDDLHNQG